MFSHHTKVLLLLLGLAALAAAVTVTFYDQLPMNPGINIRNILNPRTGSQIPMNKIRTTDLIKSLKDDSLLLDSEYDFKTTPQTNSLEAPDFTSDLNSVTQK